MADESDSRMANAGASQNVHINDRYYAILNIYEGEVYVHLHNKYKKRKRFTLKFEDMRVILRKGEIFEKALQRLYSDERDAKEELEDGDDDDLAYRQLSDPPTAPPKKRTKLVTQTVLHEEHFSDDLNLFDLEWPFAM